MKLKADTIVVGFDYTYGPKDIANVENLPKFAKDRFKIVVEPKQAIDKIKVGSTYIRKAIQHGNVELAAELLGQPYETSGIIVHGFRRGHKIGFPTANLEISGSKVLPAEGVYATRAKVNGKWHDAMTSVGYNETFKTNHGLTIETNIFDFDEEAYDDVFCESRLANDVDNWFGVAFYWCGNKPCFRPPVRYMLDREWEEYTLLDFMRILKIPTAYVNRNGRKTMFGHYIILSSYLKSFIKFYEHL